jgi:hypothetical protein
MSFCYKTPATPAALSHKIGIPELFNGEQIVSPVPRHFWAGDLIFLPPNEVLQATLHEAIAQLRARLEKNNGAIA